MDAHQLPQYAAVPVVGDLQMPAKSLEEPTFVGGDSPAKRHHTASGGVSSSSGSFSQRSSLAERRSGSLGRPALLPMALDAGSFRNSRDKEQPEGTIYSHFRGWQATTRGQQIPVVPETVKVLSYNLLCNRYATTDKYPHCAAWELAENYRCANMINEIQGADPDIICFQELSRDLCQSEYFGKVLTSDKMGYDFSYFAITDKSGAPSSHNDLEGVGIFFKRARFSLEEELPLRFNLAAEMECKQGLITEEFKKKVCCGSHNVALTITLHDAQAPMMYVVSTLHAFYDQSKPDCQTWQLEKLMKQVGDVQSVWNAMEDGVAAIVMGDFNSEPDRAPMAYLRHGTSEVQPPIPNLNHIATHDVRFGCAYDEYLAQNPTHITHLCRDFSGTVDHIYYDADQLECSAVAPILDGVDKELPNQYIPSDHYPIAAMLVPKVSIGQC